jgi:hypothetical protein
MAEREPRVIQWPRPEELTEAFESYATAVGRVAYAWNYLHEKLGSLFVTVTGLEAGRHIALAIWYSPASDRSQREMLTAAIKASPETRWLPRLPTARADLIWLMKEADRLAGRRNDAVHAPCAMSINPSEDVRAEMSAAFYSGHDRAKNLIGKDLIVEFDWLERSAETLSRFTISATNALGTVNFPWPDKPEMPNRLSKSALRHRRRQAPRQ